MQGGSYYTGFGDSHLLYEFIYCHKIISCVLFFLNLVVLLITLQGRKRGRGESSEKFSSNPLKDLSCRGLIRRVFQHLQHVNCSRGQRDFPSPEALIHHIERSHPKDKDSVTFCTRTTLHRATSSHCSVVTVKKNIWQRNILRKIFPKLWEKVLMSNKRCF